MFLKVSFFNNHNFAKQMINLKSYCKYKIPRK